MPLLWMYQETRDPLHSLGYDFRCQKVAYRMTFLEQTVRSHG